MSYIALDYGKKYIGIANSDPDGVLAFPVSVIANNSNTLEVILSLIKEKEIKGIVIGDSVDEAGEKNMIQKYAEEFGTLLKEKTDLPVYYENESFTSSHARHAFEGVSQKGRIDSSAAALILQRFLDKKNRTL